MNFRTASHEFPRCSMMAPFLKKEDRFLLDCVLFVGDVTHPRIDSFLGISLPRNFDLALSRMECEFDSTSAKKLYYMNLKNWFNSCSSWDCGINSGIYISTRVCILSAYCHVCTVLVAHSKRDSFPE